MATATERAQAHYDRWLQLGTGARKRLQWSDQGINFQAEDPYLTPDGKGIGVTIVAWTGSGQNRVDLPVDNPYQFFNPPLGIVTGIHLEQFYVGDDEQGVPMYETVTVREVDTSEAIVAAKAMVYEAVVTKAKQLGWTP